MKVFLLVFSMNILGLLILFYKRDCNLNLLLMILKKPINKLDFDLNNEIKKAYYGYLRGYK